MSRRWVEELRDRLLAAGLLNRHDELGYAEDEIVPVEKLLQRRLPLAYREFQSVLGRQASRIFCSDAELDSVPEFNALARSILLEHHVDEPLPERALVFMIHEGYEFLYFVLDTVDDPLLYHFRGEYGVGPEQLEIRFSEYVAEHVAAKLRRGRMW